MVKVLVDPDVRQSAVNGTKRRVVRTSFFALTPQGADSITTNAAARLIHVD